MHYKRLMDDNTMDHDMHESHFMMHSLLDQYRTSVKLLQRQYDPEPLIFDMIQFDQCPE